LKSEPF